MEDFLDEFFETIEVKFKQKFPRMIVKISEVRGSFDVLIKKPRRKIIGDDMKRLFEDVKNLSEQIYMQFGDLSNSFPYFPYFKLIRCYGNYRYHFLVIRKDYEHES